MQTYNDSFDAILRQLITEQIAAITESIAHGLMSHDEYKRQSGVVFGLNEALKLCDTTNTRLQER